jgi:hypothetical protein
VPMLGRSWLLAPDLPYPTERKRGEDIKGEALA